MNVKLEMNKQFDEYPDWINDAQLELEKTDDTVSSRKLVTQLESAIKKAEIAINDMKGLLQSLRVNDTVVSRIPAIETVARNRSSRR